MTARATAATVVADQIFRVASAEDIIVMKTIAGRPQDWHDVTGIIVKQGAKLDWKDIQRNLTPLLESMEAPERAAELAALRQKLDTKTPAPSSKSKPGRSKRRKKGSSE